MKNFSKTIASISMSLLTVGVMAQSNTNPMAITNTAQHAIAPSSSPTMHRITNNAHKVASATNYAFLDYPFTDSVVAASYYSIPYSSSPAINAGYYIQEMNVHYVAADTGNPNKNNLLLTACAVSFDTLIDANTLNSDYTNQGVRVDSLIVPVGQQNISGNKDSLLISINQVGQYGIPTATALWDTLIIADTGFSGKNKSWFYSHFFIFTPKITVPGTGKFAVVMQYFATNKRDSMGFLYAYPEFSCSSPAQNMADTSFIGQVIPVSQSKGTKPLIANSFTQGYSYFTAGHTGGQVLLPDAANGDFIGNSCSNPNIFSASPFQDIIMYAEVSFVSTLGVNNISASGLAVGQNYPNPFNKQTTINYSLTKSSDVTFTVYDITGRVVTNTNYGNVAPGQYQVNLSANTFSPGIYFYTFNVNGSIVTKKMVITE